MWAHGPWPLGCTSMSTFRTISQLSWLLWVFRCQISPILISYSNICPPGRVTEWLLQVNHKFFSIYRVYCYFKNEFGGLLLWSSGWESACQCKGHRFDPWSGRIPHALGQLSPFATTTEAWTQKPVICNKKSHYSEKPEHQNEEWPPLTATRESLWQQRPSTAKKKKKKNSTL